MVCISAILTGSPDHSILATDVETGSVIARLEDAHELVPLLLDSICSSPDIQCDIRLSDMIGYFILQCCSQ